jgi:peptidoglycan hydrolase CwlO-like protein
MANENDDEIEDISVKQKSEIINDKQSMEGNSESAGNDESTEEGGLDFSKFVNDFDQMKSILLVLVLIFATTTVYFSTMGESETDGDNDGGEGANGDTAQLATLRVEYDALLADNIALQSAYDQMDGQYIAAQSNVLSLQGQLQSSQNNSTSLQSALQSAIQAFNESQSENSQLQANISTLQAQLQMSLTNASNLQSALDENVSLVNSLQQDANDLQGQLNSSQQALSQLSQLFNNIYGQLGQLTQAQIDACPVGNPPLVVEIGEDNGSGGVTAGDGLLEGSEILNSTNFGCQGSFGKVADIVKTDSTHPTPVSCMSPPLYLWIASISPVRTPHHGRCSI